MKNIKEIIKKTLYNLKRQMVVKVKSVYLEKEMRPLFLGENGAGYFCGLYDELNYKTQILGEKKKEYLHGVLFAGGSEKQIDVEQDSFIPIMTNSRINIPAKMTITLNSQSYVREGQMASGDRTEYRFDYLRVKKGDQIKITSETPFVVGDTIPMKTICSHRNRMVMMLMIDSLSQVVLEKNGIENIMPNTAKFFRNGIKLTNNYCCSDWTLPGCATIFTGKYPIEHRMLHPNTPDELKSDDVITASFKKAGYMTSFFNSNWRMLPEYGYIKNFDRGVYVRGTHTGTFMELLDDLIEHLSVFSEREHFVVLSVYDLHHLMREIQDISPRINEPLEVLWYKDGFEGKSVNRGIDKEKERIYVQEIKEIDAKLQMLYLYLNDKYSSDEITVVLCSDHGVTYIDESEDILNSFKQEDLTTGWFKESMFRVPLVLRGPSIRGETCDSLSDNRVIFDILKKIAGDENLSNTDIKREIKRDYVLNESIYPKQTYKVKLIDSDNIFFYETKDDCDDDCSINNSDYRSSLYQKNGQVVSLDQKEKYEEIIRKHLCYENNNL